MRRILLYDYIHLRILPYLQRKNVFVVRYERWFSEPDVLLQELGEFLGVSLTMGHVRIQRPGKPTALTEKERALIQAHCQTAQLLGYSL